MQTKGFNFWWNRRTPWILPVFGAVKLLGEQSPIPGQNGVGFGNASDIPERFAAKALSDFGQGDPFRVGKAQSRR
jgi:hypothetical protein